MKNFKSLIAVAGIALTGSLPAFANADHWHDGHRHHDSGNGWRDLSLLGGVAALAGVATHNSTLTAVGAAGAVYSGIRYENDRASRYRGYDYGYRNDHRWRDHRYDDRRRDRHGW